MNKQYLSSKASCGTLLKTGGLAASIGFFLSITMSPVLLADTGDFNQALTRGKASVDMRLRMEQVRQDGAPNDANALTLRTRLGYVTDDYANFNALIEMTNTSALSDQDYLSPGPFSNGNTTYPVVADPVLSRINQVFIRYSGFDKTTVKIGRQRVILDNARFVGNVGWRQTEQVFDALVVANSSLAELADTTLIYAYITKAYNIVGAAQTSQSHLFNVSYHGLSFGKITGYAYLLDLLGDNGSADTQTLGIRFGGKHVLSHNLSLLYGLEFANQSEYADANDGRNAGYGKIELGLKIAGVTAKIGRETLGGDGTYGFQTVLATKHAFNGWADKFLTTPPNGLVDSYVAVSATPMGIKLLGTYHSFSEDEGNDDYGTEVDLLIAKKLSKQYLVGAKYASFSADLFATDTDKLWVWGELKF